MKDFFEELCDEVSDFFEDFWEHLIKGKSKEVKQKRKVIVRGTLTTVRPAYVFAERVDNLLRIVIGGSILVSAITATYLGFSSLSELVHVLISTFWGRLIMFVIGFSYLIIAAWKLMHLKSRVY